MKALDLIGAKFGKLTIIERAENNRHGKSMWLCKCECGNETVAIGSRIQNGLTKSCGCGVIESTVKRSTKHGLRHTKLYGIRMSMYDRCYNENCKDYKHYGGRGIKICDEWLDRGAGIQTFVDWAQANGYKEGLTIDRINVDGHYEPENCRWVDRIEQAQPAESRRARRRLHGRTGIRFLRAVAGSFQLPGKYPPDSGIT